MFWFERKFYLKNSYTCVYKTQKNSLKLTEEFCMYKDIFRFKLSSLKQDQVAANSEIISFN